MPSDKHEAAIARLAPHASRRGFAAMLRKRFGIARDDLVRPDAYTLDDVTRAITVYEVEYTHRLDALKLGRLRALRDLLALHGWSLQLLAAGVYCTEWTELDIDHGCLSVAEAERMASGPGLRFRTPEP